MGGTIGCSWLDKADGWPEISRNHLMEVSADVQCPFCGQMIELVVDTSQSQQRFTTDCENCCRPFEVVAECEPGEILSLIVE